MVGVEGRNLLAIRFCVKGVGEGEEEERNGRCIIDYRKDRDKEEATIL